MDNKRVINILAAIGLIIMFFIPCFKIGGFGSYESYSAFKLLTGVNDLIKYFGHSSKSSSIGFMMFFMIAAPLVVIIINYKVSSVVGNGVSSLVLSIINLYLWMKVGNIADDWMEKQLFFYFALLACISIAIISIIMLASRSDNSSKFVSHSMSAELEDWKCSCGAENSSIYRICQQCGKPRKQEKSFED
ncbi:MAG: hypothetical protein K6A38_06035 [Lachnospiraceae bacterium]|nr:hypothetical protein [Lachnospiraceae bacterium]